MPKPNIQVDDLVREMSDTEHETYKIVTAAIKAQAVTQAAQAAAKTSAHTKLAALGLTADEIAAL